VPSVPPAKLPALQAKGPAAVGVKVVPLLPPVPGVVSARVTVLRLEEEETPSVDPLQLVMAELRFVAKVVVEVAVA